LARERGSPLGRAYAEVSEYFSVQPPRIAEEAYLFANADNGRDESSNSSTLTIENVS
jgi:hypothetical protein